MEVDFVKLTEDYMFGKNTPHVKSRKISPSEISGGCARKIVFNRDPIKVKLSEYPYPDAMGRFLLGNAVHEYFQNEIFQSLEGITVDAVEQRLKSEYIIGSIDIVVSIDDASAPKKKRKAIIELKTADDDKFAVMKDTGPLPAHKEQIMLYMGETGIHEGYIFVINKKFFEKRTVISKALEGVNIPLESPFLQFKIEYSEELYQELIERCKSYLDQIEQYTNNGIIPDLPAGAGAYKFPCFWCQYRVQCWGQEEYEETATNALNTSAAKEVQKVFAEYMQSCSALLDNKEKLEDAEKKFKRLFYKLGAPKIRGANYIANYLSGTVEIKLKDIDDMGNSWRTSCIERVANKKTDKRGPCKNIEAKVNVPVSDSNQSNELNLHNDDVIPRIEVNRSEPYTVIPSSFEDYWKDIEQKIKQEQRIS